MSAVELEDPDLRFRLVDSCAELVVGEAVLLGDRVLDLS